MRGAYIRKWPGRQVTGLYAIHPFDIFGVSTGASSPRSIHQEYIEKIDQELLVWALKRYGDNISQTAKMLDLPRSALRSKMDKVGIAEEG